MSVNKRIHRNYEADNPIGLKNKTPLCLMGKTSAISQLSSLQWAPFNNGIFPQKTPFNKNFKRYKYKKKLRSKCHT